MIFVFLLLVLFVSATQVRFPETGGWDRDPARLPAWEKERKITSNPSAPFTVQIRPLRTARKRA